MRIRDYGIASLLVSCMASLLFGSESLPRGEWSGVLTWKNLPPLKMSYLVNDDDDSLRIKAKLHDEPFDLSNIKLTEKKLLFTWEPGDSLACELKRKSDGSYRGSCKSIETGKEVCKITMVPPPQAPTDDQGNPSDEDSVKSGKPF